MAQEQFECGNVVTLKSVYLPMTVENTFGENIWCVWFEGSELHRDSFTVDSCRKLDQY